MPENPEARDGISSGNIFHSQDKYMKHEFLLTYQILEKE